MDERATIEANGKPIQIELPCSLAEFLGQCGWRPTQVVVELNGEVVPRRQADIVKLKEGDRLEIIMPVAGG